MDNLFNKFITTVRFRTGFHIGSVPVAEKNYGLLVNFFVITPLENLINQHIGVELAASAVFLNFKKSIYQNNFIQTSKSTPPCVYFEPYGRRRLRPFLAC